MAKAMQKRGFELRQQALSLQGVRSQLPAPAYAVVDLRLEDGNGLTW